MARETTVAAEEAIRAIGVLIAQLGRIPYS